MESCIEKITNNEALIRSLKNDGHVILQFAVPMTGPSWRFWNRLVAKTNTKNICAKLSVSTHQAALTGDEFCVACWRQSACMALQLVQACAKQGPSRCSDCPAQCEIV